jgi:hypothetical protein
VGVVGASARAAVHSLARAGYEAWAVDQFCDRDLARVAPCARSTHYPDDIPELAKRFPPGPVLYTGGLENHPHIVAELACTRELWGTPPEVLSRVRDPHGLAACGLATPRLVPPGAPCPTDGRWLRKPLRSGGGLGVRFAHAGEAPSPQHYFQEFVEGPPMSALFVNDRLLGVTKQLIGVPWLHADGFTYCGNIGPIDAPAPTAALALVGPWGIDFVSRAGAPLALEVNPRYTAGMEVLEHAGAEEPNPPAPFPTREEGVRAHDSPRAGSQIVSETANSPPSLLGKGAGGLGSAGALGKSVYYAPHALTFPHSGPWDADLAGDFDPWRVPGFADIPDVGARVGAGHPVLTFFAHGSSPADVRQLLQSRAAELDALFKEHHA